MLSRVADSIYWMSRYVERAENVARFIDVNHHLTLDAPMATETQWQPLVNITGDHEHFSERYGQASRANVMYFLTFDRDNPNSIASCIRAARENARTVREMISSEMWEQINRFYLMVKEASDDPKWGSDPFRFFNEVKRESALFSGITDATLSHGEGWHFARMGRLIERADKTSRILDVKYFILLPALEDVGSPFDSIQWAAVLNSASALEAYRQAYHHITPERVVEFLVLNREFPRSIHYCLIFAEDSLHWITGTKSTCYSNSAEQKLGRLRAALDFSHVSDVIGSGLHEYLDELQIKLNEVDAAVFQTFFAAQSVDSLTPLSPAMAFHPMMSSD